MTLALACAVAVGAALGAPLRFVTERWFLRLAGDRLPWGTLIVNLLGSAILGWVLAMSRTGGLSEWWVVVLGTGFCGALTTFSGFAAQILELTVPTQPGAARQRVHWRGLGYATVSVVSGISLAALTYSIAG